MSKNYWLTTHWPPLIDEEDKIADSIYIRNGCESSGKNLKEGDEVLVYQTKQGDKEICQYSDGSEKVLKRCLGKMGIIAICKAQSKLIDHKNSEPTKYEKDKEIWWRYRSPLKVISKSGFVEKKQAEEILGYAINRSFVKKYSGLKQITTDQFKALCKAFCQGTRIMGVEVEISVDKDNISGILQAIKYRYMAEVVRDKSPGDSSAILVALDISNEAQNLCKKYNVECFIIAEDKVKQWASKT